MSHAFIISILLPHQVASGFELQIKFPTLSQKLTRFQYIFMAKVTYVPNDCFYYFYFTATSNGQRIRTQVDQASIARL